jgi:hypothetical protein
MRTIELLGTQVIPELERQGVKAEVRPVSTPNVDSSDLSRVAD